jgi:pimeloyl-ACP methyl ester carboxylesterase
MSDTTTIVTIPCFSGAPWELDQLEPLAHRPLRTMRLPEAVDDIETYADFTATQVDGLDDYVLVGDSFGAIVALALATRRPTGLRGLVLSGGFAANPVTSPLVRAKIGAARFLPGALYRHMTLRFHAASLASPHDNEGQRPLTRADFRKLFLENTPWRSYTARAHAAFSADYRDRLQRIEVPTLVITPSHDELIGPDAAQVMLDGIPEASEVVLERTGHMFRFTHPHTYAAAVESFVASRVDQDAGSHTTRRQAADSAMWQAFFTEQRALAS